jgi:plasmid maintenance system antidote protein VapI
MTQNELAARMGRPNQAICDIINGRKAITAETALQLERVLGVPASFWNNREAQYRDTLARQEEQTRLKNHLDWANAFPVAKMIQRKWLPTVAPGVAQVRSLLDFFGMASPDEYESHWQKCQLSFRRAQVPEDRNAVTVWLRRGEILAQHAEVSDYDSTKFRSVLNQIRSLTRLSPPEFYPQLTTLCASAGVVVVFVPELPGVPVSGVTRWLTPRKALIQLSLRYKTADSLWFSFFHEAGHILLHPKKAIFLDDSGQSANTPEECEADAFAADTLITPSDWRTFVASGDFGWPAITAFAEKIDIAPCIVLGRLQHEKKLPWKTHSARKVRLKWANES